MRKRRNIMYIIFLAGMAPHSYGVIGVMDVIALWRYWCCGRYGVIGVIDVMALFVS